jgi:glycosyltransferase involved in cell wall biosynthesis
MSTNISIIVPVYNVEKYLHECIESILLQTFVGYEVLLIDDGSTDSSGVICDKYSELDSRVRVFHKPNGGVSSARNLGLDNAKGEYLIFLDADDYWFDNTALNQLYSAAIENSLDIVRGEYKAVNEDGVDLFVRPITHAKKNIANKVINSATFLIDAVSREYFFVLCLIKRTSLGNLRYNVHRNFLEDMELLSMLLSKPLTCMYIPLRFYSYRKIATSVSNVPRVKNLEDSFSMCYVFESLASQTSDNQLRAYYRYNSIMMYYWTLDTITLSAYFPKRKDIIKQLCLVKLQRDVCEWSKSMDKRFPIIIKVSPIIGIWIFKIRHFTGKILRTLIKR